MYEVHACCQIIPDDHFEILGILVECAVQRGDIIALPFDRIPVLDPEGELRPLTAFYDTAQEIALREIEV